VAREARCGEEADTGSSGAHWEKKACGGSAEKRCGGVVARCGSGVGRRCSGGAAACGERPELG